MAQQVQTNSTRKGGERRNGPAEPKMRRGGRGAGTPDVAAEGAGAPETRILHPAFGAEEFEQCPESQGVSPRDCCSPASQRGAFASCGDRQMGGAPGLQQSVLGAETTWRRWI